MNTGKTAPALVSCELGDGSLVELVVKFAGGCETGANALLREAIAALLALDLGLPVPEPFIVDISAEFATAIPETDDRTRMAKRHAMASIGPNFGSRKLGPGFAALPKNRAVSQALLPSAAEILAFDLLINNPDRTVKNPNCLSNGSGFGIFDHELAFFCSPQVIGWKPPWEKDAVNFPLNLGEDIRHVFLNELRGSEPDFQRLAGAFDAITEARLLDYRKALPDSWIGRGDVLEPVLGYILELKQNLKAAMGNLVEALR